MTFSVLHNLLINKLDSDSNWKPQDFKLKLLQLQRGKVVFFYIFTQLLLYPFEVMAWVMQTPHYVREELELLPHGCAPLGTNQIIV